MHTQLRWFAASTIAAVVMVGAGFAGAPVARADSTSQLESEKTQLLSQLSSITDQEGPARSALATAESAYTEEASQLGTAQSNLASLNSQLATLDGQITTDEASASADQQALSVLVRAAYTSGDGDTLVAVVVNAKSFSSAIQNLSAVSGVSHQIETLENSLTQARNALETSRSEVASDLSQASTLEASLSDQTNALEVVVVQRNTILAGLTGPAAQIAKQIAQIDAELNPGPPATSSGACGDGFAYGTCTYYVALRRCVSWFGNGDQWLYAAAQAGRSEGSTPAVGAIAVWGSGQGGSDYTGHVAYVEAVGPGTGVGSLAGAAIPGGAFEVSEMNWYGSGGGWNRVDYRIVSDGAVAGFIY
jgi:peptidoglycan hydrolase CwlO-like protein/surface antigen